MAQHVCRRHCVQLTRTGIPNVRFFRTNTYTLRRISAQASTLLKAQSFPICLTRAGPTQFLHTSRPSNLPAPPNRDRGPRSDEDTQTDFGVLDVLGNTPAPATAIDTCYDDGFAFGSGIKVRQSGVLLVGGQVLRWRPWKSSSAEAGMNTMANKKGAFAIEEGAWGVLDLLWPKPDLLVVGTGEMLKMLAPETRKQINELGIRVEVQDTRNAAAQYNLLATERGVQSVAAALVPMGWKG